MLCLFAGCASPAGAVAEEGKERSSAETGEPGKPNELALFVGIVGNQNGHRGQHRGNHEDDADLTAGIELEHRLDPRWGIGLLAHARGDLDEGIVGVPLYFHPGSEGRWSFVGAPIVRLRGRRDELGLRLGVTYAIPTGAIQIEPGVFGDLFEHRETLTLGVGFGFAF